MTKHTSRALAALLHLLVVCGLAAAQNDPLSRMQGRQSLNEGIRAVPAPGAVTIDGDLSEWDFSGRIWSFADIAIRERYSAETAVMWDKDCLYVAFKFNDATPMANTINPVFDPQGGWKGDCVQMRVLTDTPLWITLWHYTGEKRSVAHFSYWKDPNNNKGGMDETLLIGEPGSASLGRGVQMAFKANPDGRGYTQEARIPWGMIYKQAPNAAAGMKLRMGLEFFWGPAGESTWPVHRYADNLQPGKTSREFFWTSKDNWGDIVLMPKGGLEKFTYIPDTDKIDGTIPVRAAIPARAKEFTLVIEDKDGARVRNLGAQLDADLYAAPGAPAQPGSRAVEVLWDGRDDHGKMARAGEYRVRGLSHEGLGADFIMTFFNPGTPPWAGTPGGGWGADHGAPKLTAAAGDWVILAWRFAEGGSGVIGIAPDGKKRWGEKRGATALAADSKSVYFITRSWSTRGDLARLNTTNGAYKPFVLNGKQRPFELPLSAVFGGAAAVPGKVVAMASSGSTLALAMSGGQLALLNPNSAALEKTIPLPDPRAVAFGPDGQCYVISAGKLAALNLSTGALRLIPTPGLNPASEEARTTAGVDEELEPETVAIPLAVDARGNIGLFDRGADQQIKFFKPDGTPAYTAGVKGGRAIRGKFDEQAVTHVSSIAVDSKNQVWAAENWYYPRRVSVWGRDGKLARDYIGNAGYASTGTFLHDDDSTLGYYGPVEMKLDLEKRAWKVRRVLWVPGPGELFPINTGEHASPQRFSSHAGGKHREFLFTAPFRLSDPYVLYMEDASGDWRPVSAIGMLATLSGEINRRTLEVVRQPSGEYAGRNAFDAFFWNDLNGDGRVQRDEVIIQPAPQPVAVGKKGRPLNPHGTGWGTRMSPVDLSFVPSAGGRYVPLRFTEAGAPVYGPASVKKYNGTGSGAFVPVPADKTVIALFNRGTPADGIAGLDLDTGEARWTYPNPYPGVHGSHNAPMPKPGLVIGPLEILGTASLPGGNGHVFGLRGNLGQDFFFTSDGLMIGTVFQDGRFPSMSLPPREIELVRTPMESYSNGAEPFSGWFGRHSDGKFRITTPLFGQTGSVLEMNGFDRIKRFTAPPLNVTPALLAKAATANDTRAALAAKGAEKRHAIARVSQPPGIQGQTRGSAWGKIPKFAIKSTSSNFKATAQLAHDDTNLYLAVDVEDPSPWKNEGADFARLFKTGDAVDIQLGADASASPKRSAPAKGDLRVVLAPLQKRAVAVLMRPVNPAAPDDQRKLYSSPVGDKKFDEVRLLATAKIGVTVKDGGYRLEASIPLAEIGLKPVAGAEVRGDIGFVSSDAAGRVNTARTYWSNQGTNLVNDEPMEAWFDPSRWGVFTWGKETSQ
ncbi:MAG: hypothetical protein LBM92_05865 [Opitutaceae bacterium]|jgi:hypothetical protein|nr:hypothetical protein [Opitutaceae bacterium]